MPDKKFDLGDYIEVKDRIAKFYELFGQGRLVTGEVRLSNEPDGVPRVLVQGLAYRTPDDPLPGVGWSWMELPGKSSYTKGSELENTETSAWGRAIGSLGILIDHSIASAQEVRDKTEDRPAPPRLPAREDPATQDPPPSHEPYTETEEMLGRKRVQGTIRKGGKADGGDFYRLAARVGPEGHVIGFKLETAKANIPQCLVAGPLGEALWAATGGKVESLIGVSATVAGILHYVKARIDGEDRSWYRLHVDRIETTINGLEVVLPAPEVAEPPADAHLFGENEVAGAA